MRAKWIAVEGIDGSGKSTLCEGLRDHYEALCTSEPKTTEIEKLVRENELDPKVLVLMFAADRAMHHKQVIEPAITSNTMVISDRSVASSLAYQGYGCSLDIDTISEINRWVSCGASPDFFVFCDTPVSVALERLGDGSDCFEKMGESFFRSVQLGYQAMAKADPSRWIVLPGSGSPEEILDLAIKKLDQKMACKALV